jgi:hypothetical protein
METRVEVPFLGTRAELVEVVALAHAGRLTAHVGSSRWQERMMRTRS